MSRPQRASSQDHLYRCLVGETANQHGAVGDAMKSMHLYHLFKDLQKDTARHKDALVTSSLTVNAVRSCQAPYFSAEERLVAFLVPHVKMRLSRLSLRRKLKLNCHAFLYKLFHPPEA